METYLLDNTGGFQVDRFFQSVGIFIGVFSGSFFLGFMMGLVTALVSFYFFVAKKQESKLTAQFSSYTGNTVVVDITDCYTLNSLSLF